MNEKQADLTDFGDSNVALYICTISYIACILTLPSRYLPQSTKFHHHAVTQPPCCRTLLELVHVHVHQSIKFHHYAVTQPNKAQQSPTKSNKIDAVGLCWN